jgi:trehalose 6-phosphate phosphatase
MQLPDPRSVAGQAGLAAVIAEPARALIAIDFDGTLAPIVAKPEDARPAVGAVDALRALTTRVGTVAVVTGRPAEVVVDLGALAAVPRLLVLGHYGMEKWYDGALHSPEPDPAVDVVRRRLPGLLADAPEGVGVEDKVHSLVVHTRPAADPAGALAALTPRLHQLAAEVGLDAVPGRFVVELRPAGGDKGAAVLQLAREREAHAVVFVGDDLGDLPAFDTIDVLRGDGVPGVTVASVDPDLDDAPEALAARADLVLAGPTAVVAFLNALAGAVGDG